MRRMIFPRVTVRGLWGHLSDWFDDHPIYFLLGVTVGAVGGILLLSLFLGGCPRTRYPGYYLNITNYKLNSVKWDRTPKGIRIHGPKNTYAEVDKRTDELEECFRKQGVAKSIRRDWFAVFIPPDWYTSRCGTGEQLVPSRVNYVLCEQKGLKIPIECREVVRPTKECPCPCNIRATIQNSQVIVTAPNLKLYKTELARIVLYPRANAPWADKEVAPCLK